MKLIGTIHSLFNASALLLRMICCLLIIACNDSPGPNENAKDNKDHKTDDKTNESSDADSSDGLSKAAGDEEIILAPELPEKTGIALFNEDILPLLKSQCLSCHTNAPFVSNKELGTVEIYEYGFLQPLLFDPAAGDKNALVAFLKEDLRHNSESICLSGQSKVLCDNMQSWWEVESLTIDPNAPTQQAGDTTYGRIISVSPIGEAYGFVANTEDVQTINFYINGDNNNGTMIGSAQSFASSGTFQFQLPSEYRNGSESTLYAYLVSGQQELILGYSPFTFTAFEMKQKTFYDNNVAPLLQDCSGCHQDRPAENAFNHILNPTPANGGGPTNNFLYNKMTNSEAHRGGNRCGSNNALCDRIAEWWNLEFGGN